MGLLDMLRTGTWLTRERMRLVAIMLLAGYLLAAGYLIATATGSVDVLGRPLGTDFSNVYAAGTYVLEGRATAPFDPALQHAREQQIFGTDTPFYGWHYPPFFLFVAAALALMPYGLALAVWQAVTFLLYLLTIRSILIAADHLVPRSARTEGETTQVASTTSDRGPIAPDPLWVLLAAAFPAVFVNLGHGHNGFLTTALIGLALVQLDRRPVIAGALFGLLAYKLQFGLLVPFVLAATGRWRTFAAAAATLALLVLSATVAFGPQVWDAFLAASRFTRTVVLEAGDTGWHKIQSVFSWVRMWGGSVGLAYAVQAVATLALGGALLWLWRSTASFALKAAALCLASILATPYSLDYDMMILAPAIAYFVADGLTRGFRPWEMTALAALWLIPIVTRGAALMTFIPLGVLTMIAVFVAILCRAAADVRHRARAPASAAP